MSLHDIGCRRCLDTQGTWHTIRLITVYVNLICEDCSRLIDPVEYVYWIQKVLETAYWTGQIPTREQLAANLDRAKEIFLLSAHQKIAYVSL